MDRSTEKIPQNFLDLFKKRAFAHLATIMPDGTPQVTPVWVDYDGQHILVDTAAGRQKSLNVERNPNVAIEIIDPDNPYRYLQVRGPVVEITTEGANELIDKLSERYTGNPRYQGHRPGEQRIILKIATAHVDVHG